MKKEFYFLVASFLLSSCVSDELVNDAGTSSINYEDMVQKEKEVVDLYYQSSVTSATPEDTLCNFPLQSRSNVSYPEWMRNVSGRKYLSELSIPGSHETCARVGGALVQCQSLSLAAQLNTGIRFLDIRCRHIGDAFAIHHGVVYQNLTFGNDVRNVCIDFLRSHPSECIIMMVKPEHKEERCTRSFEQTMRSYIRGCEQYFYLAERMPTLDEARGKIVLMRRFDTYGGPLGNKLNFRDNATFTSYSSITARIQDKYHVALIWDRGWKWQQVRAVLDEATRDSNMQTLYINYGSGGSSGCYPNAVADYVNPKIKSYLMNLKLGGNVKTKRVGAIMEDFVYDPTAIIQLNY